jgi:hypothetical protein
MASIAFGKTHDPKGKAAKSTTVPAAALLSFLRDSRSSSRWTEQELASTLNLTSTATKEALAILELEGYIAPLSQPATWRTTEQGETVSGGKSPRLTRLSVEKALDTLADRIRAANEDDNAPYEITRAVAFGDFSSDRARVQPAEVGIELKPRETWKETGQARSTDRLQQEAFLKQLRGRSSLIRVQSYESWMSQRSHRDLL